MQQRSVDVCQGVFAMYKRPRITSVINVGDSMEFNGRCSG